MLLAVGKLRLTTEKVPVAVADAESSPLPRLSLKKLYSGLFSWFSQDMMPLVIVPA